MKPRGRKPQLTTKRKMVTLRLSALNYNALLLTAKDANLSQNEFLTKLLHTNSEFWKHKEQLIITNN